MPRSEDDAGRGRLLVEEGEQVLRRAGRGGTRRAAGGATSSLSATSSRRRGRSSPPARTAGRRLRPSRTGRRPAHRGRRDEDAVARDLLDPPRRGAEHEGLALPRLVDHLLVELADTAAAVDEMDAEEARSGIVPAFVTASRRAPVRPRMTPAVRSQTMRGRSSANSSRDSGRRACRARSRAAAARGRRTDRRRGRAGAARRPRSPRRRRSRRSAARARRAGSAGSFVSSISPPRIARATTADSSRSARNFGKIRPFEIASSSWPARPTRCSPRATDFGLSTWTTRSTAPMSIPSSRLDVATRHGIRPAFRSSSIRTRCSRAGEPWWARATSSSASSFSRTASRSARRRLLTKTIVERCCARARAAPVDRGPDRAGGRLVAGGHLDAVGHDRLRQLAGRAQLAQVLDGDDDLEVELLARARVDELDRPVAGDEAADLREGRCVAERPIRCAGCSSRASSRSRRAPVRAPFRPRDRVHLVDDHRLDRPQRLRACEVSIRKSDSGVVIRMSGGSLTSSRRSCCDVSPVRTPTRSSGLIPRAGRAGCARRRS